jgi:hypothetical protein
MVVYGGIFMWYMVVFSCILSHKAMGATKHRDQFRAERFSDRSFNADLPEMAPERESLKNHL